MVTEFVVVTVLEDTREHRGKFCCKNGNMAMSDCVNLQLKNREDKEY